MKHEQTVANNSREIKYRPLELDSFTWDKQPSSRIADLDRPNLKQSVGKYTGYLGGALLKQITGSDRMKLEVGKTYLDCDGYTVKITGYEPGHPLPFIGDDQCGYRPDGGYLPLFGDSTPESEKHEYDLVSEELGPNP